MLINPVHNYAKTLFKSSVADLHNARTTELESVKSMDMSQRLERRCEIHEQLIDDVAKSKVASIEQAYSEARQSVTGEVVENAMDELRDHTSAIAAAIANGTDDEVARYGARTGANTGGLQAQAAEIRRRLQRRANQAEQRADMELTKLMQRDSLSGNLEQNRRPSANEGVRAKPTNAVFIGHGRSLLWRELKDFLEDRLHLVVDEFNREPVAGRSTIARLDEMLSNVSFAFIVMTAEDEDKSGELHPRANVIHEAGLFQGRLGFERAIILLEEGCAEFSNIHGLNQIRFHRGKISASFEDIRRVLEREGILGTSGGSQSAGLGPLPSSLAPPTPIKAVTPTSTGLTAAKAAKLEALKGFLPVTQEALTVRLDSGHDQGFIVLVESHSDQAFEIVGAAVECNGSQLGRINRPPPSQTWLLTPQAKLTIRWADDIHPVRALLDVKGQYQKPFAEFVEFIFHCTVDGEHKVFRKKIKVQVDAVNRSMTQWG